MHNEVVATEAIPWEPWEGFPEEVGVKTLRDDEHCGARTLLARIPPGGEIPAHSHRGVVQHFVVEGKCEFDGRQFSAGTFLLLPAHSDIPPVHSAGGAIVLMIYDPLPA